MTAENGNGSTSSSSSKPLVTLTATPLGPKAPFGNTIEFSLQPGGCVCLQGPSGRGKTTLASALYSDDHAVPHVLQLDINIQWSADISLRERCGVLFQQTTLLDELTVAGNLTVALEQNQKHATTTASTETTL